jgi:hypothetical protein
MKTITLLCSAVLFFVSSCEFTSAYGKKIPINESLEIYMKGDEVTEAETKKLGNYLAQLSKNNSVFVVRMVVDEKMVIRDNSLNESFTAVKELLEKEVFSGSRVTFIITDNQFNDIKAY